MFEFFPADLTWNFLGTLRGKKMRKNMDHTGFRKLLGQFFPDIEENNGPYGCRKDTSECSSRFEVKNRKNPLSNKRTDHPNK